jgi:hypothetical protein
VPEAPTRCLRGEATPAGRYQHLDDVAARLFFGFVSYVAAK